MAESLKRRTLLGASVAVGAGLLLGGTFAANQLFSPKPPPPEIFVPDWLDEVQYAAIGRTLLEARKQDLQIGRLTIAFAVPTPDDPYIRPPNMDGDLLQLLKNTPPTTELAISFGGGDEKYRRVAAWEPWLDNPDRTAAGIRNTVEGIGRIVGRKVAVVNLDCEAEDISTTQMTRLARTVHEAVPDRRLTMAVPATHNLDKFDTRGGLRPIVSGYDIMTYDESGLWDTKAGPPATRGMIVYANDIWHRMAGDYADISIGATTHANLFAGAVALGKPFTRQKSRTMPYTEVPTGNAQDSSSLGSSQVRTAEGIITFLSPDNIKENTQAARDGYSDTGAFLWSADGMTTAHIRAVQP